MFVERLSLEQQNVLITLSTGLISVDGVIDKREKALIESIKIQCHSEAKNIEFEYSNLEKLFESTESKVALLLELIGLAHADHEYHKEEQSFIKEVATSLLISEELQGDMENWVTRQMLLVKEANSFMEI